MKTGKIKKALITLIAAAVMITALAMPAAAAPKYAKSLEDLDNADSVVLISAKFRPGGKLYAVTPDVRAKYKDWMSLAPYKAETAKELGQLWYVSREGNVSRGYGYNWERIGTWTIFHKGKYDPSTGSAPNLAVTYTKEGFFQKPEIYGAYDDDGVVYEHFNDLTQRFDIKVVGMEDGAAIFDVKSIGGHCSFCSGGYSLFKAIVE